MITRPQIALLDSSGNTSSISLVCFLPYCHFTLPVLIITSLLWIDIFTFLYCDFVSCEILRLFVIIFVATLPCEMVLSYMCCYRSRLVFNCFSEDTDISQDTCSVATYFRCGGIFSGDIITNFLPILTLK